MKLVVNQTLQQECVDKTIAWLHHVFEVTETGGTIQMDPFYPRNELLTPEIVRGVIGSIEAIFQNELKRYPAYHRTAQGISESEHLIPPGFDQMPFGLQIAVVQGIDRIFQEYRDKGENVLQASSASD